MGRRKIEIREIQNDRNRSVTFLKRKNGLFKKAHEISVLCRVQVAVIVFEERCGNAQPRLHQYCSVPNIQSIFQRHATHIGARDYKGPKDFVQNDDEGDEDEDDSKTPPNQDIPTLDSTLDTSPSTESLTISPSPILSSALAGPASYALPSQATLFDPLELELDLERPAKRPRLSIEPSGLHSHSAPTALARSISDTRLPSLGSLGSSRRNSGSIPPTVPGFRSILSNPSAPHMPSMMRPGINTALALLPPPRPAEEDYQHLYPSTKQRPKPSRAHMSMPNPGSRSHQPW